MTDSPDSLGRALERVLSDLHPEYAWIVERKQDRAGGSGPTLLVEAAPVPGDDQEDDA